MLRILFILSLIILSACSSSNFIQLYYPESIKIIKRADWGWKTITQDFKTHEIKYITVHHGGVEFTKDKNSYESVRNLQSWSRSEKKWIDIPYHFMIDLEGNIFEARPINIPGDTNTEYNPTNHALVEVMGNYEIQEPNQDQLNSMISLIKFLSVKYNVPIGKVKTHKDYSEKTVCPGKNLYKYFENGYVEEELKR